MASGRWRSGEYLHDCPCADSDEYKEETAPEDVVAYAWVTIGRIVSGDISSAAFASK
jgi:hypothetical protein